MSESKAVVNYEEMLAKKAQAAAAVEVPALSAIGLQAGIITYLGKEVPDNKLNAIVIASTFANLYYPDKWTEGDSKPPTCYAYADMEGELRPHPTAPDPQAESCRTCEWNKFGTADNGKGKKCKNSRHLALIPANTEADKVATAEIAVMKLPVTSVATWSTYVNGLQAMLKRPPEAVVTEFSTKPDQKSQFKVLIKNVGTVDNSLLEPIWARQQEVKEMLHRTYEPQEEAAPVDTKPKKF
jgi:hypothetical protein